MENKNLESIKNKLRKLMNHEASAREIGNVEEANAFAAKISKLMLDYEIEIHEVADHKLGSIDDIEEESLDLNELTRRHESHWVVGLYNAVAKYNFCKVIVTGGSISKLRIILIGEAMNREVVHYIVGQLIPRFRNAARVEFKKYQGFDKRNTFIRSFLRGCGEGVQHKLREEQRAAEKEREQVHGLILAKDTKLSTWVEDKFGRLGNTKVRRDSSAAGRSSGYETGKNSSINKGVGGNSASRGRIS